MDACSQSHADSHRHAATAQQVLKIPDADCFTCKEVGIVDTLCAGNDLLAANEDVKGVAQRRVLWAWHCVKWSHLQQGRAARPFQTGL